MTDGRLRSVAVRVAALASVAASLVLLTGCQAPEPLADTRENPSISGPFASVGYRNMAAKPIPKTEIPNTDMAAIAACARTAEEREAAGWVRDWFAAISKLDQCDDWAQTALAGPRVRQGLVYILDKLQNAEASDSCKKAVFKSFTIIEERHAMLSTWRNEMGALCSFERKKQVANNRQEEFTRKLTEMSDGISQFRGG